MWERITKSKTFDVIILLETFRLTYVYVMLISTLVDTVTFSLFFFYTSRKLINTVVKSFILDFGGSSKGPGKVFQTLYFCFGFLLVKYYFLLQ